MMKETKKEYNNVVKDMDDYLSVDKWDMKKKLL